MTSLPSTHPAAVATTLARPMLSVAEAAAILECAACTVEEMLRDGRLAGLKPGGVWIIPATAFWIRVEELALEDAAKRRIRPSEDPLGLNGPPTTRASTQDLVRRRRPTAQEIIADALAKHPPPVAVRRA